MLLGANLPRVGEYNERVVINTLRRRPGSSQTELAQATGLALPTVAGIVRQLIGREVVRQIGAQSGARGRPRIALELNPAAGFGIGVHLDPTQVSVTLLDLAGTTRELRLEHGALTDDPVVGIARIAELVETMLSDADVDRDRVLGVGLATPGPIDLPHGRLVDPPWLPGWSGLPIVSELSRALELEVLFEKDTIAAITGERWLRVEEDAAATMIFVYLGVGVGMGLTSGGAVLRGSSGNAGEVGGFFESSTAERTPATLGRIDPAALCRAAASSGVDAIGDLLGDHRAGPRPPIGVVDPAFRELCRRAVAGDRRCVDVLHHAAVELADAVRLIADLLDADHVVFGGPYWDLVQEFYEPVIVQRCSTRRPGSSPHPLVLSPSVMGTRAGAIGAAAMVLDNRYVPYSSSLGASADVI